MINAARGPVTLLAVLAAALVWLVPGLEPPAAARAAGDLTEVVDVTFDGCAIRLINGYSPVDGTQYARTRQVWSDNCTFGGRDRTIRVRVCFKDPQDGTRAECSGWLMPTAEEPYAETEATSPTPRESIHYVEISGAGERFTLSAPEPVAAGELEKIVDVTYNGCTNRLINRYSPEDGTQYAQTRQVWSDTCTFGDRDQTIRVRVCFDDPQEGRIDCSSALMPTAEQPYAETEATSPTPRDSIHYVQIRDGSTRFALSAPEPSPPATTAGPSPASTTAGTNADRADSGGSELPESASQRPGTGHGLAAGLATTGGVLLGLGGIGFWLLRRSGSS